MASRIKGITVEIGGDTTGLDKALKSVNSSIKTTQSSLRDVNKLLKLDPTNTELLTQKQKLLKDAIGTTKEKLDVKGMVPSIRVHTIQLPYTRSISVTYIIIVLGVQVSKLDTGWIKECDEISCCRHH